MEVILKHKQILIVLCLFLVAAVLAVWIILARQNLGKIPSRGVFVTNYSGMHCLITRL